MPRFPSIPRFSSTHRIVLGLVALTVTALLSCGMLGLFPNTHQAELAARQGFCETTAISFMVLASRMDEATLEKTLESIKARRNDVTTLGIRKSDGERVISCSDHASRWTAAKRQPTDPNEFIVPIRSEDVEWGRLEVRFSPPQTLALFGMPVRPEVSIAFVMGLTLFIAFTLYMNRVLKHLSPDKVIPNRVRDALNALAEGLLVLDARQNVVLANS